MVFSQLLALSMTLRSSLSADRDHRLRVLTGGLETRDIDTSASFCTPLPFGFVRLAFCACWVALSLTAILGEDDTR